MATTWRDLILDQLDFYGNAHLWPRLEGLSDHEYLWELAAGAWSLREGNDDLVRIESVSPDWDARWALVDAGFPVTGAVANGATALHCAAAGSRLELIKDLLSRGADPVATESTFGFTPLGWAEYFQQSEVAAVLRAAMQDA